jgi:apolipoprotein N-acyltransferase
MAAKKDSKPITIQQVLPTQPSQSAGLGFFPALALAAGGGCLLVLAWPTFNFWFLTFFCLTPLWLAIKGQRPRRAFFLGWIYGLTLGLTGFYWLWEVMAGYGGLGNFGGFCILLLLAAFLALHQGIWALLMVRFTLENNLATIFGLLKVPFLGGLLWAGFDYLKNYLLTGFNWTPLAGGLAGHLPLIGAADLIGIYGLTLPVAMVSLLFAQLVNINLTKAQFIRILVSALTIIVVLYGYGLISLHYHDSKAQSEDSTTKTIAVLQASVPQNRKWDPVFRADILGRFESLLERAETRNPWLVVWPETAVPILYGLDIEESIWLDEIIRRNKQMGMLVGLGSADYNEEGELHLHNRAWLVEQGKIIGTYDKMHLVPFGEYIPLVDILPFFQWPFVKGLIGAAGTYTQGQKRPDLIYQQTNIGLMICFESTFPYMAFEKARDGANLLVVTTNDAWFGTSLAPDQHLAQAVMRAVETRLPLIRAANNGISALIAPSGRILEYSVQNDIRTFVWDLELPMTTNKTIFTRGGYYLAAICGWLTVAYAFFRLILWRKKRKKGPKSPGHL